MQRLGPGRIVMAAGVAALSAGSAARAGPPYVTDDPAPTRTGGWENYVFLSGTNAAGASGGQAGLELNYGAAPGLQLSLTVPEDYGLAHGLRAGAGDVTFGAKYRLLHASNASWLPDLAVFPVVTVPTSAGGLGAVHASLFAPVWLEKDFGRWSLFGGGGYDINLGPGQRNYGLAGLALTRLCGQHLALGLEFYTQTPTTSAGGASVNIGFGAVFQVSKHWALMGSGGPALPLSPHAGGAAAYVSVQYTD